MSEPKVRKFKYGNNFNTNSSNKNMNGSNEKNLNIINLIDDE